MIVLDLDETLVHSTSEWIGRRCDFMASNNMVYLRPGAVSFVKELGMSNKLSIWSASCGSYLTELVEYFTKQGIKFEFVWDRSYCHELPERNGVYQFGKDLNKLIEFGLSESEFCIVDDKPENVINHESRVVSVKPYYGSTSDSELIRLKSLILEKMV